MSETTTQHPERRAGQRWRGESKLGDKPYVVCGTLHRNDDFGRLGRGWHIVNVTVNGKSREDGGYVFYDANWGNNRKEMTLLADVPAAAPRAAETPNKALPQWAMTALDPGSQRMADQLQKYINEIYQYAQPSYFIPANTWLPPLAAQPAETKLCLNHMSAGVQCQLNSGHMNACSTNRCEPSKPAPQSAPAKPVQLPPQRTDCADCGGPHAAAACPGPPVPVCQRPGVGYVECDGPVNGGLCESHAMLSRMTVGLPARVAGLKRLAHVSSMHDDDLIGGAR